MWSLTILRPSLLLLTTKCLSVCVWVANMCGGVFWGFPQWVHLKANRTTSKSISSPIPNRVPALSSWQEPCSDRLSVWERWPSCLPDIAEKSQKYFWEIIQQRDTKMQWFFSPIFCRRVWNLTGHHGRCSVKWLRKLVIKQSCHCKLYLSEVRSSSSFGAQTGLSLRQVVTVLPCC